jgi:hypothetical protein
MEGYVPRSRGAQLQPQALGSLFLTSYESQVYGGGVRTNLYAGQEDSNKQQAYSNIQFVPHREHWNTDHYIRLECYGV